MYTVDIIRTMESLQNPAECGRYSPPVSPRTVSTEPSPNIAIPSDDYFLANMSSNGDSNDHVPPPYRQRSVQSDPERALNQLNRQRPPALQLATNYKLEATKNNYSDSRPQILSPRNNKPLSAVSLDIKPLDELLNERSYLLYNLQKQDQRASSLFKRYATLEEQLAEAQTAKEARKIRKDAKLLKHKITESTQQEQLIFLRLGEIYIEIQNRERWMKFRHQQPAEHPMPVYFPPLYHGTGELAPVPPPPPTPVTVGFNLPFPQPPPARVGHHPPPYPLTPYIAPQPSPAFSYSGASPLTPFSPEFVPGVAFSKDIWGRPGYSPRPSNLHQNQNQHPAELHDENQQPDTREAEFPAQKDEYDQNHNIVPWHELKHNTEGTSTPNNTQAEDESDDTMSDDVADTSEQDQTSSDVTGETTGEEDDEETQIFRNYLRAVSVNDDEMTPSALSPRGCFNWVDSDGGRKRMSLPSLRMVWPRGEDDERGEGEEDAGGNATSV